MKHSARHIPVWLVILIVGLVLIGVGISQGGFEDVFRKAALICYECIGIG